MSEERDNNIPMKTKRLDVNLSFSELSFAWMSLTCLEVDYRLQMQNVSGRLMSVSFTSFMTITQPHKKDKEML